MTAVAAVPAKDFRDAKHRLASLLAPDERAALAQAMLEDVLGVVCAAPFDAVWVVTDAAEVIACARRFPVEILAEEPSGGHTEAVAGAQARARARGLDCFVTVPGDVPGVVAGELAALLEAARGGARAAVFVPSISGFGTNGVLLRPPDAMALKFGEPSFANHLMAARGRDLAPTVLPLAGLGLDIDTPDDLRVFLARGGSTRTARLLAEWRVAERAVVRS
jgi:2-phospho-L-lactate guanylyltransferase